MQCHIYRQSICTCKTIERQDNCKQQRQSGKGKTITDCLASTRHSRKTILKLARQLTFGRTIAIVLLKPFGQTILDCLGRMHSARQTKIVLKDSGIVLQAFPRSDNHRLSSRQSQNFGRTIHFVLAENTRSDNLSGRLLEFFGKTKTDCLGCCSILSRNRFGKTILDCLTEFVLMI